jgi:hypothetical protein
MEKLEIPLYNNTENLNFNDIQENKHTLISEKIMNGNFKDDPYSYIVERPEAHEEHLLFIIHGIGQNFDKLNGILHKKIGPTIETLYNTSNKSDLLKKQIHIRMIDWKSELFTRSKKYLEVLLEKNHETKFPKTIIQQIPLDVLHYLSENKYEIHGDIVDQMNLYFECVKKFRPLFRGGVSVVGHSLGSIIVYDILKEQTFQKELSFDFVRKDSDLKSEANENGSPYQLKKKFSIMETELKKEKSFLEEDKSILILNRKKRTDGSKSIKENMRNNNFSLNVNVNEFTNFQLENNDRGTSTKISLTDEISESLYENKLTSRKVYSKNKNIKPLLFCLDHFFLTGSPLSLFLTVNYRENASIELMETVKDFHNIIHPMDPVSYRIEPLIENYPECETSFTLPHYANDGRRSHFFDKVFDTLCVKNRKKQEEEVYINHDRKLGRKRYDFIVQEYSSEKAVHMIGFLFSHQAYWNNNDVFYFIVKMIHWQGYNHAYQIGNNNYNSNNLNQK